MEELERKLKSLPVATPSPELRTRIFAPAPGASLFANLFRRRIPVGWAAVFALATGAAGMLLSQSIWSARPTATAPAVHVNIIKASSDRNVFDFTTPAAHFIPGELTVRVEPGKEI